MNTKEWAEKLNGREYTKEIDRNEENIAATDGIVVAFGYSDDGVTFCGLINEEFEKFCRGIVFLLEDVESYPSRKPYRVKGL